jgi:hypothetical protein
VPTAADAVSAGIYARPCSEHVLSTIFDEMPRRPDLLSGHDHAMSGGRYAMPGPDHVLSANRDAMSNRDLLSEQQHEVSDC